MPKGQNHISPKSYFNRAHLQVSPASEMTELHFFCRQPYRLGLTLLAARLARADSCNIRQREVVLPDGIFGVGLSQAVGTSYARPPSHPPGQDCPAPSGSRQP